MFLALGLLFILAFITALISMRDLGIPAEIEKLVRARRLKGTIVFFKKKVKHYSSSSSS
ncbi:hypothetical protein M1523_00335 [Patescibacteria group bacterium]|nr:hypothetical protein [Patescibacteria group bacterium]MCL5091916.1 hypothetical protein [Patescibacteria group bacterium]